MCGCSDADVLVLSRQPSAFVNTHTSTQIHTHTHNLCVLLILALWILLLVAFALSLVYYTSCVMYGCVLPIQYAVSFVSSASWFVHLTVKFPFNLSLRENELLLVSLEH